MMLIASGAVATFQISENVVARNHASGRGPAIFADDVSFASIDGNTFVDNSCGSPGLASLEFGNGSYMLTQNIIVGGCRAGIRHGGSGATEVSCSAFFGNPNGPLSNTAIDAGGNFEADPQFCKLDPDDYTLGQDSPCLPGQHPDGVDCGLIGALGVGCATTAVSQTSWGKIKSRYVGETGN